MEWNKSRRYFIEKGDMCGKLTELKRRFWAMLKGWNRFKFYNPEIDIKYIKTK